MLRNRILIYALSLASMCTLADFEALARTSPWVKVDTLGSTTLGRPFVMMTITSPENHARLAELRQIQLKLADPRLIEGPEQLEQQLQQLLELLLEQGRTVAGDEHPGGAGPAGGTGRGVASGGGAFAVLPDSEVRARDERELGAHTLNHEA